MDVLGTLTPTQQKISDKATALHKLTHRNNVHIHDFERVTLWRRATPCWGRGSLLTERRWRRAKLRLMQLSSNPRSATTEERWLCGAASSLLLAAGRSQRTKYRQKRGTVPTRIDTDIFSHQENVWLTQKVKVTVWYGSVYASYTCCPWAKVGAMAHFYYIVILIQFSSFAYYSQ